MENLNRCFHVLKFSISLESNACDICTETNMVQKETTNFNSREEKSQFFRYKLHKCIWKQHNVSISIQWDTVIILSSQYYTGNKLLVRKNTNKAGAFKLTIHILKDGFVWITICLIRFSDYKKKPKTCKNCFNVWFYNIYVSYCSRASAALAGLCAHVSAVTWSR